MMSNACGLDFGTSNSTVGWSHPARPAALLPLEDGKVTLPSVIFFHAEDPLVSYGRAALGDYLAGYEGRLMRSLKSLLGTSMMDDSTEVMGQAMPFRKLLAHFIRELKTRAEQAAGAEFSRAVLGRPVFFIDENPAADQIAEDTLAEIARDAGFGEIAFQYEPIAAAFDYEARITREELVLVADIGGGTSDFSLVRLSPERAARSDRRDDILANGGVHIGGTDFDRALSLARAMPLLGLGSALRNGKAMPSSQYFDLASWHTINLVYTRKAWSMVMDNYRDAADTVKLDRLVRLIRERAGHWLAIQVEAAKIALSDAGSTDVDLHRLEQWLTLTITRDEFDASIDKLVVKTEQTVQKLLVDASVDGAAVDTIFFTGGSSSVPLLRQRLAALLPQARCVEGDRFGSIGSGLALDAVRKFG
ncbi:Molecular chaperone DnaK (HSP70) [Cupriavidus necator]|uniref:Chaperone protein n=1 Tax=Cupriavidus necator (strain ATCC 17699 / DSM 428 / KCTC 22496 / NCIMB 10442 / H16 / Stanier 337) TaxID=381666 RepID=Q0JZ33_CUPNH|nr:Hsp70 family protein [Cupriavidus necator]QCC04778.1 Hsp70 family protein [Cupriavidus necator H16]QQB79470.1 Hsp70 family protein [Cupriavidus necator]WKA43702.1 Hsp70 family protein [Cupriavidus necator]CAJ96991.1 Chaperone protein [Cupriavidus necator H16]